MVSREGPSGPARRSLCFVSFCVYQNSQDGWSVVPNRLGLILISDTSSIYRAQVQQAQGCPKASHLPRCVGTEKPHQKMPRLSGVPRGVSLTFQSPGSRMVVQHVVPPMASSISLACLPSSGARGNWARGWS